MKKFLQLIARQFARNPIKLTLTMLSLALGSGILMLSLSSSEFLDTQIRQKLDLGGSVLFVANANWSNDGTYELERPGQFDAQAPELLSKDLDAVKAASIVTTMPFNEVRVDGEVYRLRSAVGAGSQYFDIFGLTMVNGRVMSQEDVDSGSRLIWLSKDLATIIYGSPEAALGKWLQPPGGAFRRGPGSESRNLMVQYQVAGVYENPPELARRSYGIADLIFPWTSAITSGNNVQFEKNMMSQVFAVKVQGMAMERAGAYIKKVLVETYGEDTQVLVWEGSIKGSTEYLEGLRKTVSVFAISLNILGMILLLISALGIFSIMVVESLNRRRSIALERALGASRFQVFGEFWSWSLALSFVGALLGFLLAAAASRWVMASLAPLAGELAADFKAGAGISASAVGFGFLMALVCGGILGALPAIPAMKGSIADTLREA